MTEEQSPTIVERLEKLRKDIREIAPPDPPAVDVETHALENAGFTISSGIQRFKSTVADYSKELFEKSVALGNYHRGRDLQREVTHDDVRKAAHDLAGSYGKVPKPRWLPAAKVIDRLSFLSVGYGLGHLSDTSGIAAALIGVIVFALVTILISKFDVE